MSQTSEEDAKKVLDESTEKYLVQSKIVSELRSTAACSDDLSTAETKLRELKRDVDQARKTYEAFKEPSKQINPFNRGGTEGLLRRRFFIAPSFEIYGGVAGLYDYGPPGCAVKNNLLAAWKQHFVVEEGMLELEGSCLTPAPVLRASGHVDKFHDLLVRDIETGDCYRADHLLGDRIKELLDSGEVPGEQRDELLALRERLDELSQEEMDTCLARHGAKAPETGNALTASYPFNLMFQTSIGPTALMPGFLRPETAQGIFVNFKRLLEFVGGKLPFACAQIGLSFRNEISPKAGLLRVREFQQAEIEHFVNADDKSHPKFGRVRDVEINMYGRMQQMTAPYEAIRTTIGKAVSDGVIGNETLGYFIGRTNEFVGEIGMNMEHVRFRQHLEHEMAHYASDCWDLEVNCSYGWVECAGLADRSAYDLENHSKKSGTELTVREVFGEAREVESLVCVPNKGALGKAFKRNAQAIMAELESFDEAGVEQLQETMKSEGKASIAGFDVSSEQVSFKKERRRVTGRSFYPAVVEPSFGIGRLLWCLWEHTYYVREGEVETDGSSIRAVRAVLALPWSIAPIKCAVLPLSKNDAFVKLLAEVRERLSGVGLISRVDDSGQSIGRRYARADELGTPFGVTVDFDSLQDRTVTVRERDSTEQVRCSIPDGVEAIRAMVAGELSWREVREQHNLVTSAS